MSEPGTTQTGRIKWYSIGRQFGFITLADGTDVFLHHAHIVYTGNGNCNHNSGMCVRAIGLIPEQFGTTGSTSATVVEKRMKNALVNFIVVQSARGPEAHHVRRA